MSDPSPAFGLPRPGMIELRMLGRVSLHDQVGREATSVLHGAKRLALLAYLALARPRGLHRRDRLIALLWPELDQAHARHALRNALHALRTSLGRFVIGSRGDEEIGLATQYVWCDAVSFEGECDAGRFEAALALYCGDLLDGFHVPRMPPEFDTWLEQERGRLREQAFYAASSLAEREEAAGRPVQATSLARRAADLARDQEAALRRLLELLDRQGDRAGAVAAYERFAHRLQEDYQAVPSAETQALIRAIRARTECNGTRRAAQAHESEPGLPQEPVPLPRPRSQKPSSSRRRWAAMSALLVGMAGLGLGTWLVLKPTPTIPLIAVGRIQNHSDSADLRLTAALGDMLSTNLAGVPEFRVVSNARVYELLGQSRSDAPGATAFLRAARDAGATLLVDGALYRRSSGTLRLDLRWTSLTTGAVRSAFSIEGEDLFALADRAAAELARRVQAEVNPRIREVTTRSLAAYRLYEEGLYEYYQRGDVPAAQRLFAAAAREDTGFAMAAYYLWRTESQLGLNASPHLGRAVRMSHRATDRERLLILGDWNRGWGEPVALAYAETLAVRYPAEPDGHYALGAGLVEAGDFLGAVPHLRQVIRMDSVSLTGHGTRCRACDAYFDLIGAYVHADSLPAAERAAREFVRVQRRSSVPLRSLATVVAYQGRFGEAFEALRAADRLAPGSPEDSTILQGAFLVWAGRYSEADRLLAPLAVTGSADARWRAEWWHFISLRQQGRFRDALALLRRPPPESPSSEGASLRTALRAQVLFELGRYRNAAMLFDSVAAHPPFTADQRGKIARHRVWRLTHLAGALAAAGDTARLEAIADTVEALGPQSAYGRDRRLHHHVRGLWLAASGRRREAETAFRRSIFSWTAGYTRTNFELARLLIDFGRAAEAVGILQAALRGPLESSNLYITRTELHELLAQAFAASGEPDSAARHYRQVASAWRNADPELQSRRDAALRQTTMQAVAAGASGLARSGVSSNTPRSPGPP